MPIKEADKKFKTLQKHSSAELMMLGIVSKYMIMLKKKVVDEVKTKNEVDVFV
jgi:hypothetical protein